MSLAPQFAHPILITQHFFFKFLYSPKWIFMYLIFECCGCSMADVGMLVLLMLLLMGRCFMDRSNSTELLVSLTGLLLPEEWSQFCEYVFAAAHRQRHKQTLKSVLLSFLVKQTRSWQAGLVTLSCPVQRFWCVISADWLFIPVFADMSFSACWELFCSCKPSLCTWLL